MIYYCIGFYKIWDYLTGWIPTSNWRKKNIQSIPPLRIPFQLWFLCHTSSGPCLAVLARKWLITHTYILVGGFKHFLFFHSVGNVIIPSDEVIFFKMVKTTNLYLYIYRHIPWAYPSSMVMNHMPTRIHVTQDAVFSFSQSQYLAIWKNGGPLGDVDWSLIIKNISASSNPHSQRWTLGHWGFLKRAPWQRSWP